jgi:coenzyme F420-reducing hydrogenase beta subunit
MIQIRTKKDCCGCYACYQACPKQAIKMVSDKEGFVYPKVDLINCIDCGICEQVCPIINKGENNKPLNIYAAINNNEKVRLNSSSGGIFTLIAQHVIMQGGVVFGAKLNSKLEVIHDIANCEEDLAGFRGSKYVQSNLQDIYLKVVKYLKNGTTVLFSGTPCQISALKLYLKKDYKNLITVDFICHGVPSPKIFKLYLGALQQKQKDTLIKVDFRNKIKGWRTFSIAYHFQKTSKHKKRYTHIIPRTKDLYFLGFINHLFLRPSCHFCPTKKSTSGSDIKLGDFWAIRSVNKDFDDNKGVSILMINTPKGQTIFSQIAGKTTNFETSIIDGTSDPSYQSSVLPHAKRDVFFNEINKEPEKILNILEHYTRIRLFEKLEKLVDRIQHILSKFLKVIIS